MGTKIYDDENNASNHHIDNIRWYQIMWFYNGKQCVRSNFLMTDRLAVLWKMAQDAPEITGHVDFWSFKVRLTPEIKTQITSTNTDLVVIPVWLTSQLQVLDSAVSKSFKDHWVLMYNEWQWTWIPWDFSWESHKPLLTFLSVDCHGMGCVSPLILV